MDRTGNDATVGDNKPSSALSDSPSDIQPALDNPLSSKTAAMSLKSSAEPTPMREDGSPSSVTEPERPEFLKDSEMDGSIEDDDFVFSEEELTYAGEVRICCESGIIKMSEAIHRAKAMIPLNLALQRATIHQIQQFFAKSDTSVPRRHYITFSRSEFLRSTIEKVEKVYFQYLVTGDNAKSMPSKAELLAIRFCHPSKTAPMFEELGGYLQAMNRADLTQVEGAGKGEQTLLGALVKHFDAMDDMKKRIRTLEVSARPQDLGHLTKKCDVMGNAIGDFKRSVKKALDRRLSKDDLDKVTTKYDKALDDLLERCNADRETAKALAAEKQAQGLKDLENRLHAFFRDHLRESPLAGRSTITRQTRKRHFTDASDDDNRLGSTVLMSDDNDVFLNSDVSGDASDGDENHSK